MPDTRGDDERQRFFDRCFEFLKHITTLSTAAALLILAIHREEPFQTLLLAVTLILIGLCVVQSVYSMQLIALDSRSESSGWLRSRLFSEQTQDEITALLTVLSGALFSASVVAFALLLLEVPFWPSIAILGTLVLLLTVLLLLHRRRYKRRSNG